MKYEKPTLLSLADAASAIQAYEKGVDGVDSLNEPFPTISAYEVDE